VTRLKIIKKIKGKVKLCVLPEEYLTPDEYVDDLINQLKKDIFPLFGVSGRAPFTVLRNAFCFIDHISQLIYGTGGAQTPRMRKIIYELASFDSYINRKYKRYADYIIQIYRHDLVHNIRPLPKVIQIIDKKGKKFYGISWFFISSEIDSAAPKSFKALMKYFNKDSNRKNLFHLRYIGNQIYINNYCLFFDLVNFLENYKKKIGGDIRLQKKFAENYRKIVEKNLEKIKSFKLDKRQDKEVKFI